MNPLGLVEVLDWAAATLGRVDQPAFFSRLKKGEAVQYFYEPFLKAFDPQLQEELGVWYTPPEVVRYMVARVDHALKDDLGIDEGVAADHVIILDPCCGTGAYVVEVLRRIASNIEVSGRGALVASHLNQAVTKRVFGFEIMPAPFVIAHLQVGLVLQEFGACERRNEAERQGIFLTNSLTGWNMKSTKQLLLPELEDERGKAESVKQDAPVLVVLGNPPYNGFAGMAIDEERELSNAYRTTKRVRSPEGQGLNDLYIRFFRTAERRIAERTGKGVVCFITNHSWLDGRSFTGMRERYLDVFDKVRIDCLNGDIRRGGTTPDGEPDPSVFSTKYSAGISVGTAIATLIRAAEHKPTTTVSIRQLWGHAKRERLLETAETTPDELYQIIVPSLPHGLPFVDVEDNRHWFEWPALPDLFPVSFPGVKTSRDALVVDVDLDRLRLRMADYFDPSVSYNQFATRHSRVMSSTSAETERRRLIDRGGPREEGFVQYAYRPFDTRWLYWEDERALLDRPRPDYRTHIFDGNIWIEARERDSNDRFSRGTFVRHLADNIGNGLSTYFPAWLNASRVAARDDDARSCRPNLSLVAERYLQRVGGTVLDLFHHALATIHNPRYRRENAAGLRLGWPRIPIPGWPAGAKGRDADEFWDSARIGQQLADLLDSDVPVSGVTKGTIRRELSVIAVPASVEGSQFTSEDFAVTASWGHFGPRNTVRPGIGLAKERELQPSEMDAMQGTEDVFDTSTIDIYLNRHAFWRNVPTAVWNYRLGGYQVLKKWLSYREYRVLGRPLRLEEAEHFMHSARRIAAILILSSSKSYDTLEEHE